MAPTEEELRDQLSAQAAAARGDDSQAMTLTPVKSAELMTLPQEVSPYAGAGMMELTDDQVEALLAPFDPIQIDIKSSGEVYIPQVHYRGRLNKVFRPGGWALVPMSEPRMMMPKVEGKPIRFHQLFHLTAKGCFVAQARGEMDYNPKNANSSEATAIEGVKSNALMRCCKDLGIGAECWDRRFTTKFKQEHCVLVMHKPWETASTWKRGWRRKDAGPFEFGERPLRDGE